MASGPADHDSTVEANIPHPESDVLPGEDPSARPEDSIALATDELVIQAYRGALGRDPEPGAFEIFGSAIRAGAEISDVIAALIASPEFQAKWNREHEQELPPPPESDPDMVAFRIDDAVTACYRTLLGRDPEAGAFEIFGTALRSGASLTELIGALVSSGEFQGRMQRDLGPAPLAPGTLSFTIEEIVAMGYRGVLRRDPEPSAFEIFGTALRDGVPLSEFIEKLVDTPECRATRRLVRMEDDNGLIMATSELTRLSASMERAIMTLAMGAVPGSDDFLPAPAGGGVAELSTRLEVPAPPPPAAPSRRPRTRQAKTS